MTQIILDISTSLDGFVAGPSPTLEDPLGQNGMQLHEWVFGLATWRSEHGQEGGVHDEDDALVARSLATLGAVVMGRKMFSGGSGPWEDDPNAAGWWGDEPPFRLPVFVVTHHEREPKSYPNGTVFMFVTEGVESAIEQARAAADGKDVRISGGASVATQALRAGLLDRLDIHIAPVLLGAGTRLFEGVDPMQFELVETPASPNVTHVTYVKPLPRQQGDG
jgi:dihydrofolate reductase